MSPNGHKDSENQPKDAPVVDTEGAEDDETWTNQPRNAAQPKADDDASDGPEDEEDEAPPAQRKPIKTARDVLYEEVAYRARRAQIRLRSQLSGCIAVEIKGSQDKFLFDWRTEEPTVTDLKSTPQVKRGEETDASMVDCLIRLSESHLFQVRSGELNPQLAMLGEKITVQGRVGLAIYFFNLICPRQHHG